VSRTACIHDPQGELGKRARTVRLDTPRGYTLMEVLLVLALMVIIASLAALNLRGAAKQRRLKTAANQIRAAWAQARNDAIKTGRVHVFHYAPQSRQFFTMAHTTLDDPALLAGGILAGGAQAGAFGNNLAGTGAAGVGMGGMNAMPGMNNVPGAPGAASMTTMSLERKELPEDVRFLGAEVRIDQRSSFQLSETTDPAVLLNDPMIFGMTARGETPPADQWGIPIYFYPDGTTSSAELMLFNDRQQTVSVYLRGLTGLGRVGRVQMPGEMLMPGAVR
jgi:type II secretion system protein H